MDANAFELDGHIPGVFEARQSRSVKTRDGFIVAGVEALKSKRFGDLKISELAAISNNSVGSFYTRFQDKDAFFTALSAYASQGISREFEAAFTVEKLRQNDPGAGLDALVDLIGAIFASNYRGVLRETYLRIMDEDDPWAPFRQSAKQTLRTLHDGLGGAFEHLSPEETKTRLSFCFQLIVGVIQNDMINKNHVFTLEDGSVLSGLKETLRAYMGVPLACQENV